MWTNLSCKKVNIKKPHCCHGCGKRYLTGPMIKNVAVDGGDFSSTYWCLICDEFMSDKWRDLDGEGIGYGDIYNYDDYKAFRNKFKLAVVNEMWCPSGVFSPTGFDLEKDYEELIRKNDELKRMASRPDLWKSPYRLWGKIEDPNPERSVATGDAKN